MANLTEAELQSLRNSKNEQDWIDTVDRIKHAHGGRYPDDWWPKVSGLMESLAKGWGQPDAFEVGITVTREDAS